MDPFTVDKEKEHSSDSSPKDREISTNPQEDNGLQVETKQVVSLYKRRIANLGRAIRKGDNNSIMHPLIEPLLQQKGKEIVISKMKLGKIVKPIITYAVKDRLVIFMGLGLSYNEIEDFKELIGEELTTELEKHPEQWFIYVWPDSQDDEGSCDYNYVWKKILKLISGGPRFSEAINALSDFVELKDLV